MGFVFSGCEPFYGLWKKKYKQVSFTALRRPRDRNIAFNVIVSFWLVPHSLEVERQYAETAERTCF